MNPLKNQLIEKIKNDTYEKIEAGSPEKTVFNELLTETRMELTKRSKQSELIVPSVKDLFASVRFHDVTKYIEQYTEMDKETYAQYKEIFESVKKKETTSEQNFIMMKTAEEGAPDVHSLEYDKGVRYSFTFVNYAELANYKIHPLTFENYSKEEIAAGILEEFSWHSDDEEKEETKEQLEEAIEELEQHQAIEKAEKEGTISIFGQNTNAEPFTWKVRKEEPISEDETIRHYAQHISFEKLKAVLKQHYADFEEQMKVSHEEALQMMKQHFLTIRKKINAVPKEPKGYQIRFDRIKHFIEVKQDNGKMKGLYSGESVYDLVDEKIKRTLTFSNLTKEEVYLSFMIALLKETLGNDDYGKNEYKRDVQVIKRIQETSRIIEKAKSGVQQLTWEELLIFSNIIEHIEMDE